VIFQRYREEADVNIFLRELRANLKSLAIWCGILVLLIFIASAKFSAFAGDPSMLAILNSMPKALVDAMSLRAFNLTTLSGFYGLMFIYFALMGGIAAAMWSSDIISKEERDKTVEFSLVLPVSRSKVITAKLLTALLNCIVFVLVTWGVSLVAAQHFKPDQAFYSFLTLEMEAMFVIELVFLAVGLLLGCAMKQYKRSGSTAVAIILATYFMAVISGMEPKLDFLKYFTPFKFFDASVFFRSGSLNWVYLLISAGIIVVCVIASYIAYNKRDLYI
jgi:ABC-2 type transport system permease protein